MATFAKQFSCFLFIVLCTCCQIESRESKFFSKYVHLKKDVLLSSPTPAPQPVTSHISNVPATAPGGANYGSAPAPAPEILGANYGPASAPAPAPENLGANYGPSSTPTPTSLGSNDGYVESESNWYYGIYTKGNDDSSQENAEFPTEFSTENPVFSTNEFSSEQENQYSNENREENGYFNNLNNENGLGNSNHRGSKREPEGMRGKNYYDVEHNNYSPRGHELARENNYEEGYYYGNYGKPKYEFDSMEEYEKQEGYADIQQEFIP